MVGILHLYFERLLGFLDEDKRLKLVVEGEDEKTCIFLFLVLF